MAWAVPHGQLNGAVHSEATWQPELVRTLSVQPPRGAGRIRLLEIPGVDLQPCGGTHVAATGEIGPVAVTKIESKGRRNKRVYIAFAFTELVTYPDFKVTFC